MIKLIFEMEKIQLNTTIILLFLKRERQRTVIVILQKVFELSGLKKATNDWNLSKTVRNVRVGSESHWNTFTLQKRILVLNFLVSSRKSLSLSKSQT